MKAKNESIVDFSKEKEDRLQELKEKGSQLISSLTELKEQGLYIIEDDELVVETHLPEILKKKGLNLSDLAKLTGISRQNINAVIRNKMKPGIDFVLKVSYVLNIPAEELFTLTENAWVQPFKLERDTSVYVDVLNLLIVKNEIKRQSIAENGFEYFNTETKERFTKEQRDKLQKEYVEAHLEAKEKEVAEENPKLSKNSINSQAVEELKKEFGSKYNKIYKRLGEKIQPYVLNA